VKTDSELTPSVPVKQLLLKAKKWTSADALSCVVLKENGLNRFIPSVGGHRHILKITPFQTNDEGEWSHAQWLPVVRGEGEFIPKVPVSL